MKSSMSIMAFALFPIAALAADAVPGPDWAFLTPDANAPAPAPPGGGGPQGGAPGGGRGGPPAAAQADVPGIVAMGKGSDVRPCSTCHTPSGMGQPESANLRGLNAAYIQRQMADYKNGLRTGPRAAAMTMFAKALSDDEVKQIAAYYAGLKDVQWTRMVEAGVVPKTAVGRNNQRTQLPDGGTEPVGDRVIEFATSPAQVRQMADPAFVAFVPPGSLGTGKVLVTMGGVKTTACASCHGDKLQGMADVPAIAGRSPVAIARQLYSFKNDLRKGAQADIMKTVAAKLTDADVIGISAYVASLDPS